MPTANRKPKEKPLTPAQLAKLREDVNRKLVEANPGAYFIVGGLWCADFIGYVTSKYHRSAEFRIARFVVPPTADNYKSGDVLHVVYDTEQLRLSLYQGE